MDIESKKAEVSESKQCFVLFFIIRQKYNLIYVLVSALIIAVLFIVRQEKNLIVVLISGLSIVVLLSS